MIACLFLLGIRMPCCLHENHRPNFICSSVQGRAGVESWNKDGQRTRRFLFPRFYHHSDEVAHPGAPWMGRMDEIGSDKNSWIRIARSSSSSSSSQGSADPLKHGDWISWIGLTCTPRIPGWRLNAPRDDAIVWDVWLNGGGSISVNWIVKSEFTTSDFRRQS